MACKEPFLWQHGLASARADGQHDKGLVCALQDMDKIGTQKKTTPGTGCHSSAAVYRMVGEGLAVLTTRAIVPMPHQRFGLEGETSFAI